MRIGIVGAGRLGTVFARALSKEHEVLITDRDLDNLKKLSMDTGVKPVKAISELAKVEMVIIAVKPSNVSDVISQLKDSPLLVSCAAGIPIKKLESFGSRNVIRIMPNIAAEVNEAVIAYSLHPEIEHKEKVFLTAFSALGLCIKIDESQLDPITAASGSGPAFVSYFAQAMIDEAIAQGLHPSIALKAVAQTLVGTGKLLLNGYDTKKVIDTVASPGGTTEAGLKMLDKKGVATSIRAAAGFSTEKARELGK